MTTQIDYVDHVSLAELRRLARQEGSEADGTAWVTISMPTHRTGAATRQDPIRFRNLASQALEQLNARQVDSAVRAAITAELDEIAADHEFWQHQTGGLVVLTSGTEHVIFRLPVAVAPRSIVDDGPALAVLVPFIADDTLFRILTLSSDSVRLLEGTISTLGELDLGPIPADYETAFGHIEMQRQLQSRSSESLRFHGHGGGSEAANIATTRYLRAVAAGLDERLRGELKAPLLLAGMTSLAAEFRQISDHPKILAETLTGSHDKTPAHELHGPAWQVVHAAHAVPLDEANDRIHVAWAREQALLDVTEILRAAGEARIDSLFIAPDAALDDPRIEQAVRITLQMGGEVHPLEQADRRIAALLRY